jgi:hypothetical protein
VKAVTKQKDTIKPLDGAPRDPGRRFFTHISTDVYCALVKERDRRQDADGGYVGLNVVVEDALIAYLGIESEETDMEKKQ